MSHRLLLIEETPSPLETALAALGSGMRYVRAAWSSFTPESIRDQDVDLVVAVAFPRTPEATGLFRWLQAHPVSLPILAVLPGDADPELLSTAFEAVDDFILWPARTEEWCQRVARMLGPGGDDVEAVQSRLTQEAGLARLVGRDPSFLRTIEKIPALARSGWPVLITGETGTGKELCARAIHHLSRRRAFPFIAVDCGAFPDHLLENELFGHARGAYTDARDDQKGLISLAEGGTLFLDEVDALSSAAQVKLLRFLEDRVYRPLGAERFLRADVNILAATNADLDSLVRGKSFRSDLYYRLNVLRLELTPLRKRRGDIEILARHFVARLCAEVATAHKTLTPPTLRKLSLYEWPGNVRELFNVLRQAVVFAEGPHILPGHIAIPGVEWRHSADAEPTSFRQARSNAIAAFERGFVEDLLRRHHGNVTRASVEAQKDRRAFGRLIKKYGVKRSEL